MNSIGEEVEKIKMKNLRCKRCGYRWKSRKEKPTQCPKCKSQKWDMNRKNVLRTCACCGAVWESRVANPIECPRCKSMYWRRGRKTGTCGLKKLRFYISENVYSELCKHIPPKNIEPIIEDYIEDSFDEILGCIKTDNFSFLNKSSLAYRLLKDM